MPAHPTANDHITNARLFICLPSLCLRLHCRFWLTLRPAQTGGAPLAAAGQMPMASQFGKAQATCRAICLETWSQDEWLQLRRPYGSARYVSPASRQAPRARASAQRSNSVAVGRSRPYSARRTMYLVQSTKRFVPRTSFDARTMTFQGFRTPANFQAVRSTR
jgi:hypothetical protein